MLHSPTVQVPEGLGNAPAKWGDAVDDSDVAPSMPSTPQGAAAATPVHPQPAFVPPPQKVAVRPVTLGEPIVSPAAWTVADALANREEWIYELTDGDAAEIVAAARAVTKANKHVPSLTRQDFPLPTLGPVLEKIGESVTTTGRGFYLLRNFPVSEAILSREELVAAWFGVGLYWGRAVSQNAKGHVVGHVKRLDSADASDPDVRIYATSAAQPWHVDDADLVALLCLRKATCVGGGGGSESVEGDRSEDSTVAVNADDDSSDDTGDDTGDTNNGINESTGQTKRTENTKEKNKSASGGRGGLSRWVSSLSVYNKLLGERPDLVRELSRPFAFDKRGEVAPGTSPFVEVPVLTVHEGTLTFVFNDEYIRSAQRHAGATPLTPEMEEAIRAVTEAAESRELHLEWDLEPGDVQLIWNWSQLHTRTAYDDPPAFGERRHLLRLWLEAHGVRHPFPPAFPRQAHGGIPSSDGVLRAPLDAE